MSWRREGHRRNGDQIGVDVEGDCRKKEANAPSYLSKCSTTERPTISDFCRVTSLSAAPGSGLSVGRIVVSDRRWRSNDRAYSEWC